MPGQFGPTSLVFPCVFNMSVIRTMSLLISSHFAMEDRALYYHAGVCLR